MIYLLFLPVALTLSLYLIPAILLGQPAQRTAKDYFVASSQTSPTIFQNSSIAYQLQMATFGPFFVWGMTQDYIPALVNSLFFLFGLIFLYSLRRPLLAFLNDALRGDTSITVHEFLARQYGDARSIRLVASALTLFALVGVAIGESFGVLTVISPILHHDAHAIYTFVFGMLVLMFLYTVISGNSGVMRSDQAQLGVSYVGLFGASLMMIWSIGSGSKTIDAPTVMATTVIGAAALAMLLYRRFRFLDTSLLQAATTDEQTSIDHTLSVRTFNYFERILNVSCIALTVGTVIYALLTLSHLPIRSIGDDLLAQLQHPTSFSTMGILALAILPFFYQFVDITNWQRLAAFEKTNAALSDSEKLLRRSFLIYTFESPIIWMLMCVFGTLAAVAYSLPKSGDISSLTKALETGTTFNSILLLAFLAAVFAIALSTMSAVFSASLAAIRYDILPSLRPGRGAGHVSTEVEASVTRRTVVLGIGIYVLVAVGLYAVDSMGIKFGSAQYLSILFAFYCAQLSFVPLILGPIILRPEKNVSSLWALFVLVASALAGIGTVGWYLYSGNDFWLWGAVPACLFVGSALYVFRLAFAWAYE